MTQLITFLLVRKSRKNSFNSICLTIKLVDFLGRFFTQFSSEYVVLYLFCKPFFGITHINFYFISHTKKAKKKYRI